jgi:hypothetical protein
MNAQTLVQVDSGTPCTIDQLVASLRRNIVFARHAVEQVWAWTGAEPLTLSIGGEYEVTITLA